MINAPSEIRCKRNAGIGHHHEGNGENQRDRNRDDKPGAHAQAEKADGENDDHGLKQRFGEARHGMLDDDRLIGDQMNADADRQVGNDL